MAPSLEWLGSRTATVVLIAAVSVAGAFVAWFASGAGGQASGLQQQGIQQLAQREGIRAKYESRVNHDARLIGQYQEHLKTQVLLRKEADEARPRDPELAGALDLQAEGELAVARGMLLSFVTRITDYGNDAGDVTYDRDHVLDRLLNADDVFPSLQPEAVLRLSRRAKDKGFALTGVGTALVVSLFFLTLAQFAPRGIRELFALSGVLVLGGGLIGWAWIETVFS